MSLPQPQEREEYSYADYLTWSEDERWEIVNGIAYMQAAPTPVHQEILTEILKQIAIYLTDKSCKVYPAPFCVRLTKWNEKKNENIKKVFEPDITIVCDKSKIDKEGCKGVPDMIIEILSPSSFKMDRVIKFNEYETAGVKEYWIVEPDGKIVSTFILQKDGRYGRTEIYTENDKIKVSIFPDLIIDLEPVFASI